jgi:hypothetical protein
MAAVHPGISYREPNREEEEEEGLGAQTFHIPLFSKPNIHGSI